MKQIPWNKNLTKETDPRIAKAARSLSEFCKQPSVKIERSRRMQGNKNPAKRKEVRQKIALKRTGTKASQKTKSKMSKSHLESKVFQEAVRSEKRCDKISKKLMNHKVSLDTRIKNSRSIQNLWNDEQYRSRGSGENSHYYIDGRSELKQEYSKEWTGLLKEEVKKRDNFTCQLCKKSYSILAVHHIDYNKKNSDPSNLITLCRTCHAKTNKDRNFWKDFFQKLSFTRYSPNLLEIMRSRQK